MTETQSPETYIGYSRAENFISPGGVVKDESHVYATAAAKLDQWSLAGDWTVGEEKATLNKEGGRIAYRFRARDLHLVLGSADEGKQIRFRVTIDGAAPGADHGADIDADGRWRRQRAPALPAHSRERRRLGSHLRDRVS